LYKLTYYINPSGVGITNTISRAELAAIATAIIHGYSHIAADSLSSMHQINKQFSHPNLHRHIQGEVLQSIAKAIHQSLPSNHFYKGKSHAGIVGNEYDDALARKSITSYSDIANTCIKTACPEGNSLYNIYWLQKNIKNTESYKINQTQPSHLPHGFGTYPISMAPC
jgi:hypothetical protein